MPNISSEPILRPWQEGDEEGLVRVAHNPRVARNLRNRFPHPYQVSDAAFWIANANTQPADAVHWAIIVEKEIAGGIGFERLSDTHGRTAEIGYWIGEEYWGRGLATQALKRASHYAWQDFDFMRIEALVLGRNIASQRVLEKAGYTLEARHLKRIFKNEEFSDELMYAFIRKT